MTAARIPIVNAAPQAGRSHRWLVGGSWTVPHPPKLDRSPCLGGSTAQTGMGR
jgi:hypothetical protein